ncbi:hypothetical protein BDV95DRAFT_44938 [Massariosphaeria phaeospora]|uniref:Transmembrane protein n=1 Tax=Massariosphaeria phaeospora TaxID=100035 RepID=A0A7C8I9Q5_9PLEO|nr:hypothetical protein BDV95DRAFT_44938 [Massariosphaeria phaeospora]
MGHDRTGLDGMAWKRPAGDNSFLFTTARKGNSLGYPSSFIIAFLRSHAVFALRSEIHLRLAVDLAVVVVVFVHLCHGLVVVVRLFVWWGPWSFVVLFGVPVSLVF